jgi:FkbM family methyltransferase
MKRCRDFEKTFPLVPDTWHRCHQYAISDTLMPDIRIVWSFGVSKECRMEHWIRTRNGKARIHTWDPTPISQMTIRRANQCSYKWPIKHTNKAYDPSKESATFYTSDPTLRCYSLENFNPENLVDSFTVECTSLAKIKDELGGNVDLIKFDIEGRWYEICNEILDLDLPVKQVVGEFEMYMGDADQEFDKLESIIKKFEQSGYKTYCNRLLPKQKPAAPCVELAFIRT